MAGGFWKEWSHDLLAFALAIVTIVGGIAGLWLVQAYKWIFLLFVLTGIGASVWNAFRNHRQRHQAEETLLRETARLEGELDAHARRTTELQRQLDGVNTSLIGEIAAHLAISRRDEFARDLIAYIDFVGRMWAFEDGLGETKPEIRRFVQQNNQLYVVAKVEAGALAHLAVDDRFLLVKRDLKGVEVAYARLVAHQSPNIEKKTATFRVVELLSDEAKEIVQLAAAEKTPVSKQFEIRLMCDPNRYRGVDFPNLLDDLADQERGTP